MGQTPIYRAVCRGHEAVARMLAQEFGADVNRESKKAWTPILQAAHNGDKAIVRMLAEEFGASVSKANFQGETPLLRAAANGHVDVVRLLAELGADVAHSDKDGWTALIRASANGHHAVALLVAGELCVDVNRANRHGQSPLILAAEKRNAEIIRVLVSRGAHPFNWNTRWTESSLQGHAVVAGLQDRFYLLKSFVRDAFLPVVGEQGVCDIVAVYAHPTKLHTTFEQWKNETGDARDRGRRASVTKL